ncbi:MAG: sigma-70 family RNA polymerase sigma factor [Actinobacteria bacterium]|nr:sigma-70 family RNA polymerase sigma factor [Actinomycetota bacterium]
MTLPPFQALLDAHGAAVHRFLVASVGPSEADDCFQEACIAALRAYPQLTHADNLRGWLLRIAQRKVIDAHRARTRRPVPVPAAPEPVAAAGPPPASIDGQPAVWARVRALPEKQRVAVFLRSAADLSYAEVAEALGCSQDAARRNVHEGLKRLREEWSA